MVVLQPVPEPGGVRRRAARGARRPSVLARDERAELVALRVRHHRPARLGRCEHRRAGLGQQGDVGGVDVPVDPVLDRLGLGDGPKTMQSKGARGSARPRPRARPSRRTSRRARRPTSGRSRAGRPSRPRSRRAGSRRPPRARTRRARRPPGRAGPSSGSCPGPRGWPRGRGRRRRPACTSRWTRCLTVTGSGTRVDPDPCARVGPASWASPVVDRGLARPGPTTVGPERARSGAGSTASTQRSFQRRDRQRPQTSSGSVFSRTSSSVTSGRARPACSPRRGDVEDAEVGDDPLDDAAAGVGQRALVDDLVGRRPGRRAPSARSPAWRRGPGPSPRPCP